MPLRFENSCLMTDVQPTPLPGDGISPRLQPFSALPDLERVRGHARLGFDSTGGNTRLVEFYQSGSAKMRMPRVGAGEPREAVLLNTAGGLTGGDQLVYDVSAGAGTRAVVSTQAAERIYRRCSGVAEIETNIVVGDCAHLDWLPQETIIFDNSALSRRLCVDIAPDAKLFAVESIVLGRAAMGETTRQILLNDSWRIRRAGKLVFADSLLLDGDANGIMAGGATGKGATAIATVLLICSDAEDRIATARAALDQCQGEGGASAWNGMLVARLIASSGQHLRSDIIRLVEALRGVAMPRVWNC